MCGIFGHYLFGAQLTRQQIIDILFSGLRCLEYRGYDSAGFLIEAKPCSQCARQDHNDNGPLSHGNSIVIKSQGNITALRNLFYAQVVARDLAMDMQFDSHVAIAHTRWATHGEPSERNAHPVTSGPNCEFAVVHNGVITNHAKLQRVLSEEGIQFTTDTDTEVIPMLCELLYSARERDLTLSELVMQVLRRLEGAYALLVTSAHYPGELVAARRGSPLMLGVRNHRGAERRRFRALADLRGDCFGDSALECFIASDDKALIEHTRDAVALEDGDLVHIKGGGWGIFNVDAEDHEAAVPRMLQRLEGRLESVRKGDYEHFMQKEIFEQPESIAATMRGRVKRVLESGDRYLHPRITLGGLEDKVSTIRRSRRIVFVACGTSFHACIAMRPMVETIAQLPVVLELASDLMDRQCPIFRDDTAVFLSQSGETADTLAALRYAKSCGALCVGITNTVGSSLSRETECGVHLNAGYEMGVASTKAYTSQCVVLAMIALLLARDSIAWAARRDRIADALLKLPDAVCSALALDSRIRELAGQLKETQSLLVFGRGDNYATALEAALKVKEVAQIHSEGILAGELKHGPLALIDSKLPVVVIATKGRMYGKMINVLQQLKARGARLIVICSEGDSDVPALLRGSVSGSGPGSMTDVGEAARPQVLFVPETEESLQPIVNVVPMQLLSYHLTVLRGLNVDQPRNLAKSVTVTEQ